MKTSLGALAGIVILFAAPVQLAAQMDGNQFAVSEAAAVLVYPDSGAPVISTERPEVAMVGQVGAVRRMIWQEDNEGGQAFKGALIGGGIGVVVGVLLVEYYKYGTERPCGFGCYAPRIAGGGAVGAVIGGMFGSLLGKEDNESNR